jgi:hypothetical protein
MRCTALLTLVVGVDGICGVAAVEMDSVAQGDIARGVLVQVLFRG